MTFEPVKEQPRAFSVVGRIQEIILDRSGYGQILRRPEDIERIAAYIRARGLVADLREDGVASYAVVAALWDFFQYERGLA